MDVTKYSSPNKGIAFLPKWGVDTGKHELNRAARLSNNSWIEYISFVLPNRTGIF